MICKKTIIFIFCVAVIKQSTFSQQYDLGSWNILNLKYNRTNKLSFFGEAQLRSLKFYNNYHYYEYKGGFNYKLNKSFQLSLGAGSYQTFGEGGNFVRPKNNDEIRLWPQLILFQEINRFKIEQRYRAELRWTSNGYRNRFRYRIGVSYPFGEERKGYKLFMISLSNELFFTDNEPYFERNRFQASLNFKPSKLSTIQIGYLHQFDYRINDETGRDFLVVGFFYELFRRKTTQMPAQTELKDY
ncbi:MAG: DUF2490 domain-containing protein [Bacteroidota bacterium]